MISRKYFLVSYIFAAIGPSLQDASLHSALNKADNARNKQKTLLLQNGELKGKPFVSNEVAKGNERCIKTSLHTNALNKAG